MYEFEPRNLDGIYYRVKRNGKSVDRCFSDLTPEEQAEFLKKYDKEALIRMIEHLTHTMNDMCLALNENECRKMAVMVAEELRMFGDMFDIAKE